MPKVYDDQDTDAPDLYAMEEAKPGSHDAVDLNDDERAAFDDISDGYDEDGEEPDYYKDQSLGGGGTSEKKDKKSGGKDDKEGDLFNEETAKTEPKGRLGKLRAKASDKKKKIALFMAGSAPVIIAIVIILGLFGNLKIVHYYKTMLAFNFARATRVSEVATSEVLSTADELAAAGDTTYVSKTARLTKAVSEKLDRISPNRTLQNLGRDEVLKFNYTEKPSSIPTRKPGQIFARKELTSVKIGAQEVSVPAPRLRDWIKNPLETYRENLAYKGSLQGNLSREMSQELWYVRSKVTKRIFEKAGVRLRWFERVTKTYKAAKAAAEAGESSTVTSDVNEQARSFERTAQDPTTIGVDEVDDAAKAASKSAQACVEELDCAKRLAQGDTEAITKEVLQAGKSSTAKTMVSTVSGLYAIAVPLCLIFQGTDSKSLEKIDATDQALAVIGAGFSTAANQLMTGDANSDQIGAVSRKFRDSSGSVVTARNGGGTLGEVDPGPETNSSGGYGSEGTLASILNSSVVSFLTRDICPVVTEPWVGVGVALASIVFKVISAPSAPAQIAAEEAGKEAVGGFATRVAGYFARRAAINASEAAALREAETLALGSITRKVMAATLQEAGAQGAQLFTKKGATKVIAEVAIIFLARGLVLSALQNGHQGVSRNGTALDEADMGLNITARNIQREQNYGRPMTQEEEAESYVADQTYLADKRKEESVFDRYLALNGTSLLSNIGVTADTAMVGLWSRPSEWVGALSRSFGNAINNFGSAMVSLTGPKVAHAVDSSVVNPYKIMPFGWTTEELNLLGTPAYTMEANRTALGSNYEKVEKKYAECWDSDKATIGKLVSAELVQRNTDGSIKKDKGLCSPKALSPAGRDNEVGGKGMVFRYRVAKLLENQTDHLLDTQEVTADPSTPTPSTTTPSINGLTCPDKLEEHPSRAGYFKMPDAPAGEYLNTSIPARRYGSKQQICVLYTVAMAYSKLYPGKSRVRFGDLTAAGHNSHFWGTAVDVDAGGPNRATPNDSRYIAAADRTGSAAGVYSPEATIALGKLFIDTDNIYQIWWCERGAAPQDLSGDDGTMTAIRDYAKSTGKSLRVIKCLKNHENHFHVDIKPEFKLPYFNP